ncbi:hypothetical protein [Halobacterium zhouii]|uniref:hypothetical protein n=1 Tax=Halobacterium zhouii TaxID=2902624 RepID=UPI001E52925F|nr:hypothetical protein [Halobacterium zhouii]
MPVFARNLLPHLVVVAAILDAAIVAGLGLRSYTGVLVFVALFFATLPALYGLAVFVQPDESAGRDPDGV